MQRPSESSGKLFRKGVRQLRQKNSAVSGAGSFKQSAHTGTREKRRKGRLQMRHSSGKSSEKRPCDTVPKIGGKNSESDTARLLLEKTHLPVNLHSTTNPPVTEPRPLPSRDRYRAATVRERSGTSTLAARMNLLRQVVVQPDLLDDMQLPFQVIDVMLFVQQDLLEQLARPVVAHVRGHLDRFIQPRHRIQRQRQVVLQLRFHVRADLDRKQLGHVGYAFEKKDALHQDVGVLHLFDGFLPVQRRQPLISPALAHFGVQEILVNRSQLRLEHFVQQSQDLFVTAHSQIVTQPGRAPGIRQAESEEGEITGSGTR